MWIEIKKVSLLFVLNSNHISFFEINSNKLNGNPGILIQMISDKYHRLEFHPGNEDVRDAFYIALKMAVQGVSSELNDVGYVKVLLNDEIAAEASYLRRLEIINSLKRND